MHKKDINNNYLFFNIIFTSKVPRPKSTEIWKKKLNLNEKHYFITVRIHGSLEAILSLTKMTQKTETGDGCGVMSGVLNNGF
jgi:hypothetical protein